jgi:ubiquinone/menaquinone biosynthesis C-methylase UbiE
MQFIVPPRQRGVEIGCGRGDLLAALRPSYGLGVDFSSEMLSQAKKRHPDLYFIQADAHELNLNTEFDFVILSDLLNDLWDVQTVCRGLHHSHHPVQ